MSMRKLTKIQAVLLIFVAPFIAGVLLSFATDNIIFSVFHLIVTYGLISIWYRSVLKTITESNKIVYTEEMVINCFLVTLMIYPAARLVIDNYMEVEKILSIADVVFIFFGMLSLYLLGFSFEKVLSTKGRVTNTLVVCLTLAIYPVGIWFYQEEILKSTIDLDR
jgi:hypothetical protein